MANNDEKTWNRPWGMEEMIDNAENWSLAGDVALLNTLKAYSEKLLTKTVSISDNVDNLLHTLDEVSLKLDLSQNEFQSLRSTQFIESRVYEDDETLDVKEEIKTEQKPPEEEKDKILREAVLKGLCVMDKYFEKIEVSISDSEDEDSDKSYLMRPKDLYADRPLPLVIGTEQWYKKWHVGLADSSSESESEKVSETYSDSESGDDLPKDLIKGSETSSELDFSSQTSDSRPVANSTFNDSVKKPNIFGSDDESDGQGSLPVTTPISNKNFAEQLAAKLGDVINERQDISAEINRKPIQPAQRQFADDLFSDEPPPIDDLEDTILPKSAQEGLFSGGRGLFDDNEDEPFWGQQIKTPTIKPQSDADVVKQEPDRKVEPTVTSLPKSSQVSKGLFDSDSESGDEDIFIPKQNQAKKPFLQPYTTTAPLFAEEPPELDVSKKPVDDVIKKKPVGGVSIFGKSDLFSGDNVENILKSRQDPGTREKTVDTKTINNTPPSAKMNQENIKSKRPNLFDDNDEKINSPEKIPVSVAPKPKKISLFDDVDAKPSASAKPKTVSLFDDDDDLFKDDLFGTKKFKSNLFDDDLFPADVKKNEPPKVDLFKDLVKTEDVPKPKPRKNISLFNDNDAVGEEEDLFGERVVIQNKSGDLPSNISVKKEESTKEEDDVREDEVDRGIDKSEEQLPRQIATRQVIGAERKPTEKTAVKSLFDKTVEEFKAEIVSKEIEITKPREVALFGEDSAVVTGKSVTDLKISKSLFEDSTEENVSENVFKKKEEINDDIFGENQTFQSEKEQSTPKKSTKGLFDDSTEEIDDENLFRETTVTKIEDSDLIENNPSETTADISQIVKDEETGYDSPQIHQTGSILQTSNVIEKAQPKNVINLFGSSPPPDDDDWDTKSGQSSDNDDQFSYRTDYNTAGSSLFDNEPPSLGPNESSGIVRDQNTTRVDIDDSCFSPQAMSSRRLSSDVFNDQQSQDSFFVTKNKTDSITVPPQLDSIPETNKSSNLDITPSGVLEDLGSSTDDSSVFQDNSPNNQTVPSASTKPVSLFDDDFDSSPDTDSLFSSIPKSKDLPKLSNTRSSLFDNFGDVFSDKDVNKPISSELEKKPAVKVGESIKEIEAKNVAGSVDRTEQEKQTKKPPVASPGKLKHNLKINVNALMPGSAPPKLRELMKSHSLELPKDGPTTPTDLGSPNAGFLTPTGSQPHNAVPNVGPEKATSFEDTLNNVEVLHSVTKDRAKIPIKRRPSTRRGRHQVIQNTANDFTTATADSSHLAAGDAENVQAKPQEVESVTERTDREFSKPTSPQLLSESPQQIKTAFQSPSDLQPLKKSDFFDDIGNGDDIIPPTETGKNAKKEKPKSSIFGSDGSDDELFGRAETKRGKKEVQVKKKSLFNDSSSDEDLFSSASSSDTKRRGNLHKPVEKKTPKTSATKKLENIETDEDPLSSLLK